MTSTHLYLTRAVRSWQTVVVVVITSHFIINHHVATLGADSNTCTVLTTQQGQTECPCEHQPTVLDVSYDVEGEKIVIQVIDPNNCDRTQLRYDSYEVLFKCAQGTTSFPMETIHPSSSDFSGNNLTNINISLSCLPDVDRQNIDDLRCTTRIRGMKNGGYTRENYIYGTNLTTYTMNVTNLGNSTYCFDYIPNCGFSNETVIPESFHIITCNPTCERKVITRSMFNSKTLYNLTNSDLGTELICIGEEFQSNFSHILHWCAITPPDDVCINSMHWCNPLLSGNVMYLKEKIVSDNYMPGKSDRDPEICTVTTVTPSPGGGTLGAADTDYYGLKLIVPLTLLALFAYHKLY